MYIQWRECAYTPGDGDVVSEVVRFEKMPAKVRPTYRECKSTVISRAMVGEDTTKWSDLPESITTTHVFWKVLSQRDAIRNQIRETSRYIELYNLVDENGDPIFKPREKIMKLIECLKSLKKEVTGKARLQIRNKIANFVFAFADNPTLYLNAYLNVVLLGPPGSGKTTIAKVFGKILSNLGILTKGTYKEASRATLVGQYIGETSQKTLTILLDGIESVLFIDEAYAVAQATGGKAGFDQYGQECINEIVGFLDKHRGKISVIAAGYELEMEKYFYAVNPGVARRFPYRWVLADYDADDLLGILKSMLLKQEKKVSIDNLLKVEAITLLNIVLENFKQLFSSQAGDMETLMQKLLDRYQEQKKILNADDTFEELAFIIVRGRELPKHIPRPNLQVKNIDAYLKLALQSIKKSEKSITYDDFMATVGTQGVETESDTDTDKDGDKDEVNDEDVDEDVDEDGDEYEDEDEDEDGDGRGGGKGRGRGRGGGGGGRGRGGRGRRRGT